MNKTVKSSLLVAMATMGVATVVSAATPDYTLDTVVVTANRVNRAIVDTAADVNVLTAKELENGPYQNVTQALNTLPGVVVTDSGFAGSKQKVTLNGDSRVVVLIDGRRVNLTQGTAMGEANYDFQFLPPIQDIEKVEVVKGGSSTLYGSDAVGGVINIITKSGKLGEHGTFTMGFGSWGANEIGGTYSVNNGKDSLFISTNRSHQDRTSYKEVLSGDNKTWPDSDKTKSTADIHYKHKFNGNSSLAVDFNRFNISEGGPYNIYNVNSPAFKTTSYDYKGNSGAVTYNWNESKDTPGFLRYYKNNYQSVYKYQGFPDSHFGSHMTGIEAQQNFNLSDNDSILVGAEHRKSTMYSEQRYADGLIVKDTSAFVDNTFMPTERFTLTTGARYSHNSEYGHKWTGSVGANQLVGDNGHAYVAWNQVFQAPQGDSIAAALTENILLKPATGYTWNYGYSADLSKDTNVGVNAFYNDIKNGIQWAPAPSGYYVPQNIEKQKERGVSLSVKHALNNHWNLSASYTHVKAEKEKQNKGFKSDLTVIPNVYHMALNYTSDKFTSSLIGRYGSGADKTQYVKSHYFTMDMSMRYQATENLGIYANVFNLTNEAYANYAGLYNGTYNYPAPGRHYTMGVNYKF